MMNVFRRRLRHLLASQSRSPRRRKTFRSPPVEALEDRCLLTANLNLIPSGLMIYGGTGVDNDLTISFDGTNYTFSDPSEPINAIGGLTGLDTNLDPNIVTFDPTAIGGAFTQVVVNPNVGNDTTTVASFRDGLAGGEGLDIRDDAGEGTDTVNINGDIGSAANPVANQVLIRGENLNLGADIYTNNFKAVFSDDVDLTADALVDVGTATAQFDGDIDGAFALDIDNAGSAQIAGDIGSGTPLDSVDLNAGDQIQIGGSTTATGDVDLTAGTDALLGGDVLAGAGGAGSVVITSPITRFTNPATTSVSSSLAAADSVSFSGAIDSSAATDLTLSSGLGALSIGGAAAGLGDFNVASSDTTHLDGVVSAEDIEINATTSLTAEGFQASAGDVDINTPSTTFDGAGSTLVSATGSIDFSGTITGNSDNLAFRNASTLSITGAVTDVDLFDARRGGGTLFTSVSVNSITAGDIIIEADNSTILLFGDLISAGDITLIGRVEVFADIMLLSGQALGDDIIIFGSVHDAVIGAHTLILDAGSGAVQNLPLPPDVGIGVGGDIFLNVRVTGCIVTLSDVAVANDIVIEGGIVHLNGSLSGSGDMIFRPKVAGGTLNVINGPLGAPLPDMTISGLDLALVVPGFTNVILGGPTTGAVILHPHHSTGPFQTIANTRFEAALITINDDINQGADDLLFVGDTLTFNRSLRGTGDVHVEDFGATGTVTVNGAMTYPAGLGAGAMDIFFDTPGSDVVVNGALGHRVIDLTVDAATASFPAATAVSVTGNVNITGDAFITGGIFSVTGSVMINGDLELTGNATLKIPIGEDFVVTGDVIGNGFNLVIRGNGGAIDLVDIQGDVIDVGVFAVDSSGGSTATTIALESVEANDIVLRGVDIQIEGIMEARMRNLHLVGAVELFGNTSLLNTSGVSTHYVRVDGTIDGGFDLNVDSGPGQTVLTGAIGGISPLANMTVLSTQINYLTVPIVVLSNFTWTVGTFGNGINDRLFIVGAGSVTAGIQIDLEADQVVNDLFGVNLIAPTLIVTERGIGN